MSEIEKVGNKLGFSKEGLSQFITETAREGLMFGNSLYRGNRVKHTLFITNWSCNELSKEEQNEFIYLYYDLRGQYQFDNFDKGNTVIDIQHLCVSFDKNFNFIDGIISLPEMFNNFVFTEEYDIKVAKGDEGSVSRCYIQSTDKKIHENYNDFLKYNLEILYDYTLTHNKLSDQPEYIQQQVLKSEQLNDPSYSEKEILDMCFINKKPNFEKEPTGFIEVFDLLKFFKKENQNDMCLAENKIEPWKFYVPAFN